MEVKNDKQLNSITLNSLNCSVGNKIILSNINFTAEKGEVILITGPNGIGKSTLLKTILGLLPILKGQISINQEDYTTDPSTRQEQLNFIGHKNALQGDFTILENLSYWQSFFSSTKTDILKLMEFWDLPNIRLSNCSEGQKKKTALARLSIIGRSIWLLDEPTANLDILGQKKLKQLLESHSVTGGISIISTHNPKLFEKGKVIELSRYRPEESC